MNSSDKSIYNQPFSHIYVEKDALAYPVCKQILDFFSSRSPQTILIQKYQEVFGRTHQNFTIQKNSPSLILAVKHGNFLYPGAPVCQNFGFQHFYYTSFVMNCLFDCEYCYLQGMYPSSHIVIFVNLEDYFTQLHGLLAKHPVYLCISYDTDLLALDAFTGFISRYLDFAAGEPLLTTELRTKSAVLITEPERWSADTKERFILAYTLSPDEVQRHFEHHTPSLKQRLCALRHMAASGFPVRLCFDPLLRIQNYKQVYKDFFQEVKTELADIEIRDASIGVFRISDAYLKQMRKQRQASSLLQYPFTNENHVCHYGQHSQEMIASAVRELSDWIPAEKIFTQQDEA